MIDIMDPNKELQLLGLKTKLLITLKNYLTNMHTIGLSFFYRILEILKQKYSNTDDFSFIEQLRCNVSNSNISQSFSTISSHVYTCNNENLLKDLLNSIDTGFNYNYQEIKS